MRLFFISLLTFLVISTTSQCEGLSLNINQAVQMALANNYTIQIERLEPDLAIQNLHGELGSFDPVFIGSYHYNQNEIASFNNALEESANASIALQGVLPWGTSYRLGVSTNDRTSPFELKDNGQILTSGSAISTRAGITLTQPLLRGFGATENGTAIHIAKKNQQASVEILRLAVIDIVTETINAYYDLFLAEQSLIIYQQTREHAAQLLRDNRKRVEKGALAPIDLILAESEVALRDSIIISAEQTLKNAENRLKEVIGISPEVLHSTFLKVEKPPPPIEIQPDAHLDYPLALANRPDYLATQLKLETRDIEITRDRQASLPQFDLIASAGRYSSASTFSSSFDQLRHNSSDSYSIGAVFSFPIFNRTRNAQRLTSYLHRTQAELQRRKLEQAIAFELDNAATSVSMAWKRVLSTRNGQKLAIASLEAEEKRLQVGTSSTFIVLRLQNDLAIAEISAINALVDYYQALSEYDRVRGITLEHRGIEIH